MVVVERTHVGKKHTTLTEQGEKRDACVSVVGALFFGVQHLFIVQHIYTAVVFVSKVVWQTFG